MRRGIAIAVVAGLAIAIVLLWPGATDEGPPIADPTTTTATTAGASSSPTSAPPGTTTTTTVAESHVVETVAEAEEILRNLWFGWFEGIYNQDEDRDPGGGGQREHH